MIKIFVSIFSFILVVFFTGCSSKQYFEPQDTKSGLEAKTIIAPAYIKSINTVGATLDNNIFIDNIGISKFPLTKGYYFVNNKYGQILVANKTKELLFLDTNETIKFKSNVIGATAKENLIAILFSNNSIGLYDKKTKQFKLKKYFKNSPLNDTRITMPIFLDKIILYPTLDGKVIVVDIDSYKVIKTLTVDPENEVKNIILLKTIGDTLIAATPNKIISLNDGELYKKDVIIQSYIVSDKFIYIATLDGTILKLNLKLNIIKKKKFKFAKFQTLALGEYLYGVESQGYIVKLSKDFEKIETYNFPFEEDEKIFVNKNKIYIENRLVIVK